MQCPLIIKTHILSLDINRISSMDHIDTENDLIHGYMISSMVHNVLYIHDTHDYDLPMRNAPDKLSSLYAIICL